MSDVISIEDLKPYCAGFSAAQLEQAKNICDTYQLTPVKRQIHLSLRNKKDEKGGWTKELSFLVTVDGLRGIAERGGAYQGQVGPFWCGSDGVWKDVWLSEKAPAAAKIGVYKGNFREALFAVAKFDEYKQTTKDGAVTGMWLKMPATMVAKCAEALAIRRAFPDETSGIYTVEEMQQVDNGTTQAQSNSVRAQSLDGETGPDGLFSPAKQQEMYDKAAKDLMSCESLGAVREAWKQIGKIAKSLTTVGNPLGADLDRKKEELKQYFTEQSQTEAA